MSRRARSSPNGGSIVVVTGALSAWAVPRRSSSRRVGTSCWQHAGAAPKTTAGEWRAIDVQAVAAPSDPATTRRSTASSLLSLHDSSASPCAFARCGFGRGRPPGPVTRGDPSLRQSVAATPGVQVARVLPGPIDTSRSQRTANQHRPAAAVHPSCGRSRARCCRSVVHDRPCASTR